MELRRRGTQAKAAPTEENTGRGRITVANITVVFGEGDSGFVAIDRVSADIASGEFVCILGPSGCGKSTVMNTIAGFDPPSSGAVLLDDVAIEGPGADRGMVFQQPALFPWKSVRDNVAHGPRMLGKGDAEANRIADELLEMVGLSTFAASRPHTLSGGMQQRAAIARALANRPSVLMMDEPFGALDAQTRAMMQENLLQLWSEVRPTVVFITHDIDEAIFLADRILVMSASPGRIIAEITVDLERPRTAEMMLEPDFVVLKRRCIALIREQSLRAFEQQAKAIQPAPRD